MRRYPAWPVFSSNRTHKETDRDLQRTSFSFAVLDIAEKKSMLKSVTLFSIQTHYILSKQTGFQTSKISSLTVSSRYRRCICMQFAILSPKMFSIGLSSPWNNCHLQRLCIHMQPKRNKNKNQGRRRRKTINKENVNNLACNRFCAADSPAISTAVSTTPRSLNLWSAKTSLLASMREKSRMSEMRMSKVSPECLIVLTRSRWLGVKFSSARSCMIEQLRIWFANSSLSLPRRKVWLNH